MHEGDPALYSGTGNNLDRAIVRSVAVPAGNATLTFESLWNLEEGWDFGVVQVSTDGGATYRSISCTDTTSEHDPGAIARIVEQLPGFTGYPGGWQDEECSLAPYAGQTILISFRLLTDPLVEGQVTDVPPGWWVDDVAVGGEVVSDGSSLDGWRSPSQVRPTPVPGWTVQLISYSTVYAFGHPLFPAHIHRLRLDRNFDGDLNRLEVLARLGLFPDVVAAIVTAEDPEERLTEYPCYTLKVNGVTQPGGC
jgi:immune inhibitor InhA-like protein